MFERALEEKQDVRTGNARPLSLSGLLQVFKGDETLVFKGSTSQLPPGRGFLWRANLFLRFHLRQPLLGRKEAARSSLVTLRDFRLPGWGGQPRPCREAGHPARPEVTHADSSQVGQKSRHIPERQSGTEELKRSGEWVWGDRAPPHLEQEQGLQGGGGGRG